MWVGLKNYIRSDYIGSEEILKLWGDNGTVDTGDYYLSKHCITPLKPGKVIVYSIQKVYTGIKWDTVSTKNTFTAIVPPKIMLQVIKDNFKKDTTIQFVLIDKKTNLQLPNRYKIGRMYQPNIYNSHDSLIGHIQNCFATTIEKRQIKWFIQNHKLESG